jgi:putative membrane protein
MSVAGPLRANGQPQVSGRRRVWRWAVLLLALAGLAGFGTLALALVRAGGFTMHMVVHVANIAVLAPGLAWLMPQRITRQAVHARFSRTLLAASFAEWAVLWFWHTPRANAAATAHGWAWTAEQISFLLVAFWLWLLVVGAWRHRERLALGQSIVALLFTSMHMTLLGAALSLSPRPFFRGGGEANALTTLGPLTDVQVGGALMLVAAGSVYLAAALACAWRLLETPRERMLRPPPRASEVPFRSGSAPGYPTETGGGTCRHEEPSSCARSRARVWRWPDRPSGFRWPRRRHARPRVPTVSPSLPGSSSRTKRPRSWRRQSTS